MISTSKSNTSIVFRLAILWGWGQMGWGPRSEVEERKHPFENTQNSFSCASPLLWSILSGPILEIRACIQFFRKKGQYRKIWTKTYKIWKCFEKRQVWLSHAINCENRPCLSLIRFWWFFQVPQLFHAPFY